MRWKDDIPEEVKQDRLQRLLDLQNEISNEERQQMLGTDLSKSSSSGSTATDKQLKGRTRCWKKVIFDGDESLIGTLQKVKVHSYSHQTLLGELARPMNIV